jgi:uncharacterized protein involved in exopolysaccharide biosynthesis
MIERTLSRPPASALEALLITFFANYRRILWVPGAVIAIAVIAAVLLPTRYPIEAQVLVTQGPEYTYQAPAGEPATVSQSLDHDQVMHTEATILESADLHRATLRAIGVDRLYPDYVHPGLMARLSGAVHGAIDGLESLVGLGSGVARLPPDPVNLALREFESALSFDIPKIGSVITITFRHKDAALGAQALNEMLTLYVQRRAELFRNDQSAIVAKQVEITKAALTTAETKLADFQLSHKVGGFEAQRDILLRRRGELQTDRADAQSQVAQYQVRLAGLTQQLSRIAPTVTSGRDTDFEMRTSPARSSLEQLRAQYANAQVQYRPDAPLVQALRAQIAAREADVAATRDDKSATTIRTSQNPTWLSLQDDKLKSETNLSVQKTRLEQDDQHLTGLGSEIAALDESEEQLAQLQLERTVSEDAYRSATKILDDRRVIDAVEAQRRPTARVLQPAVPPLYPAPLRRLVLGAGVILAIFALLATTLLMHAFSRTYWLAETMELELGIPVIAVIRELPVRTAAKQLPKPG